MTDADQPFRRDYAAAVRYETCLVPYLLRPWIPDLISYAGLRSGNRVLDVACGTGAVTMAAAARIGSSGRIVGLDISPEMLRVARESSTSVAPRIQWERGDAASLPFATSSFDVVLCQQGLQFFADRRRAVEEFRRVLSPHGKVAVLTWSTIEKNPYCLALARTARRHLGDEVSRQLQASFSLGQLPDLEKVLTHPGFNLVEVQSLTKTLKLPPLHEFVPRHFASTSLATSFASADAETQAAIITDVVKQLQTEDLLGEAFFPFEVNLGLAQ
jgi:ubiquinone/menaquinone biosynthesis C-methylase UbiE